jgi:YidC/Oxa1 family membrane protein insertase
LESCYFLFEQKGGESGMNWLQDSTFGQAMLIGLPTVTFFIMSMWPSSLQLYFAASSLFGLSQTYLLNSPTVRQGLNLAPLPIHGGSQAMDPRRLRLIEDSVKPRAQISETRELPPNVSLIDRWVESAKKPFRNMRNEYREKMSSISGDAPAKNADGTPAAPSRLSKADLKRAEDYERRRKEEAAFQRSLRNAQRQAAHEKNTKNKSSSAKAQQPKPTRTN